MTDILMYDSDYARSIPREEFKHKNIIQPTQNGIYVCIYGSYRYYLGYKDGAWYHGHSNLNIVQPYIRNGEISCTTDLFWSHRVCGLDIFGKFPKLMDFNAYYQENLF